MRDGPTPPHVRYATAVDGVRIAYTVTGTGPAIVHMPPLPLRHVELEWTLPEDRAFMELLGRGRTLIGYDPRGLGLSERAAAAGDLESACRDLDAVLDDAAIATVALFAAVNTGPMAIAYAATRPARVSHLILWCTSSRADDVITQQMKILFELMERDPELASEAAARVLVGWSAGDAADRYARLIRAAVSPDGARALLASGDAFDARPLLARVTAPTLVLHRRDVTWLPLAHATELAAGIRGARLVILDGASMRPGCGDAAAVARTVDELVPAAVDRRPTPPIASAAAASPAAAGGATPPDRVFRREGEFWTLTFAGTTCRVRDAKGMHHVARLLHDAGSALPATELVLELERASTVGSVTDPSCDRVTGSLGDAGKMLDAEAKRAYRARLAELRSELTDAERCNDPGCAAAARAELDAVAAELAAGVGLGGRDRKAASAAERARLAVTKRIKDALARIAVHHPALADHLRRTIRTGALCSYAPAADDAARWEL